MAGISNAVWIGLGVAGFGLILFFVLQKMYWLDRWVKALFFTFIGMALLFSVFNLVRGSGATTVKTVHHQNTQTKDSQKEKEKKEQIAAMEKREVKEAEVVTEEIDQIIKVSLEDKRKELAGSLKEKNIRKFAHDSTLLRLETFEQLMKLRQAYLEEDIGAYEKGKLDKNSFLNKVQRFKTDVDSLVAYYNVDENLSN